MRELTDNQRLFLRSFLEYQSEYVDNGNVMDACDWRRQRVASVGRGLIRRELVDYTAVDELGFEGGVWKLLIPLDDLAKALRAQQANSHKRAER